MKNHIQKAGIFLLGTALVMSLAGCDIAQSLSTGTSNSGGKDDRLYSVMRSLVNSPNGLENLFTDYNDKNITISAYILSEPEEMILDGVAETYVYATLAKTVHKDDVFCIQVDDIKDVPAPGEVVSIEGTINGYIYYTADNKMQNILDVKAKKMTVLEPTDDPDTANEVHFDEYLQKGSLTFVGAELKEPETPKNAIVVYFEYTNLRDSDSLSPISHFDFYQGEEVLKESPFAVEEIDPQALKHSGLNMTKPQKTSLYYIILQPYDGGVFSTEPIYAVYYDDDFNCTNEIEIAVS